MALGVDFERLAGYLLGSICPLRYGSETTVKRGRFGGLQLPFGDLFSGWILPCFLVVIWWFFVMESPLILALAMPPAALAMPPARVVNAATPSKEIRWMMMKNDD